MNLLWSVESCFGTVCLVCKRGKVAEVSLASDFTGFFLCVKYSLAFAAFCLLRLLVYFKLFCSYIFFLMFLLQGIEVFANKGKKSY